MKILIAGLFLNFFITSPSLATDTFDQAKRAAYIQSVSQIMTKGNSAENREVLNYVSELEKGTCRSLFDSLTLKCMQIEIRKYCELGRGRSITSCAALTDLAAVNKINERLFISRDERFKISQKAGDFEKNYSHALETKYALLASELLFASGDTCQGAQPGCLYSFIDTFCEKKARAENIPWQACVGAVTYYMGVNH